MSQTTPATTTAPASEPVVDQAALDAAAAEQAAKDQAAADKAAADAKELAELGAIEKAEAEAKAAREAEEKAAAEKLAADEAAALVLAQEQAAIDTAAAQKVQEDKQAAAKAASVKEAQRQAVQKQTTAPAAVDGVDELASLPAGFSSRATTLYSRVYDYTKTMRPSKPVGISDGCRAQTDLYRALIGIINNLEDQEFKVTFGTVLQLFARESKGVFHEKYVFRFFEHIAMAPAQRASFQRLLNLLVNTAEVKARALAIKQINLEETLKTDITEAGRQRIQAFYNV